jgi:hypothetical protein
MPLIELNIVLLVATFVGSAFSNGLKLGKSNSRLKGVTNLSTDYSLC